MTLECARAGKSLDKTGKIDHHKPIGRLIGVLMFRLAIPLLFVAWATWTVLQRPKDFENLKTIPPSALALLVLFQILSIWVTSLYTRLMTSPFGLNLVFKEYVGITVISRAVNMILPMKGGAAVRALYLKRVHHLPITRFTALFAGQSLVSLLTAGGLGLIAMLVIYKTSGQFDWLGCAFFAFVFLSMLLLTAFPLKLPPSERGLWVHVRNAIESWNRIRANRKILARLVLISLANAGLTALSITVAFHSIEHPVPVGVSVYLGSVQDTMYLASITPGALGLVEGLTIFLGAKLAIPTAVALMVALIVRCFVFLVSVVLAPLFIWLLAGEGLGLIVREAASGKVMEHGDRDD